MNKSVDRNAGPPFDEQDLRGMPRDLSWCYLTPPEHTRRLAAELRAQRERHEAKIGWPVPAFVKDQKFSTTEMLHYLAMNKLDPDFGIPAAVIDAIAIALAGKGGWLKAQKELQEGNERKQSEADRRREEVRRAAESLRAKNPGIGEGGVEKILADRYGCSVRTIRRYITED